MKPKFLTLIVLAVVLFIPSIALCNDLSSDLKAYYPLDGNANDRSGNGNNGVVEGATPIKDRLGDENNALYFNGSSKVQLPKGFEDFRNGFTFTIWVNTFKQKSSYARLIELGTGIDKNVISFCRYKSTDRLLLHIGYNGPSVKTDSGVIKPNTWQFFSVTMDSTGLTKIYVDGNEEGSGTIILPPVVLRDKNFIGHSMYNENYVGLIDEVRIYNRALDRDEILELYYQ